MKILRLNVKKKWFDLIQEGKKLIDYRSFKPYWTSRLVGKDYDIVEIKNGYQKNTPKLLFVYEGYGKLEGETNPLGEDIVYTIFLGKRKSE